MEEEGGPRHGGTALVPDGGGADLISALPEDLLLQVLVRLRCAAAAARTSLLSRRWRGLWTRLPDLVFRGVALDPLLHELASLQAPAVVGPVVPLLDIRVPAAAFEKFDGTRTQFEDGVSSLLQAAAVLSPVELRFAVPPINIEVKMPHFDRATSIELLGLDIALSDSSCSTHQREDSFPALESLSLSACIVNLTDLVLRCPRLRLLREASCPQYADIVIKSASLQELDMESVYATHPCRDPGPQAIGAVLRHRLRGQSGRVHFGTIAAEGIMAVQL